MPQWPRHFPGRTVVQIPWAHIKARQVWQPFVISTQENEKGSPKHRCTAHTSTDTREKNKGSKYSTSTVVLYCTCPRGTCVLLRWGCSRLVRSVSVAYYNCTCPVPILFTSIGLFARKSANTMKQELIYYFRDLKRRRRNINNANQMKYTIYVAVK